ncbi:archease [Thermodesulfobacteriota bacterium]
MTCQTYRIIEHPADTGFEVRGSTREQLFEKAAHAFFHIMWSIGKSREVEPAIVVVTGSDLKELLVNFLEEFLYLYDAKGLLCTHLEVLAVTDTSIRARASLQQFDEKTDQEILAVKAVTYHQLYIGEKNNEFQAQVFLDI